MLIIDASFPDIRCDDSLSGSQKAWHIKNVPFRLTSSTSSQSASDRLPILASLVIPALLTKIDADEEDAALDAKSSAHAIASMTCVLLVTLQRDVSTKISLVVVVVSRHSSATLSNLSCRLSAKKRLHLQYQINYEDEMVACINKYY